MPFEIVRLRYLRYFLDAGAVLVEEKSSTEHILQMTDHDGIPINIICKLIGSIGSLLVIRFDLGLLQNDVVGLDRNLKRLINSFEEETPYEWVWSNGYYLVFTLSDMEEHLSGDIIPKAITYMKRRISDTRRFLTTEAAQEHPEA